jgi:hypothetical protein
MSQQNKRIVKRYYRSSIWKLKHAGATNRRIDV